MKSTKQYYLKMRRTRRTICMVEATPEMVTRFFNPTARAQKLYKLEATGTTRRANAF